MKSWLERRINWLDSYFSTGYSSIQWANPDSVILFSEPGHSLKVPVDTFFHSPLNIDSVTFVSDNPLLEIRLSNDSVEIISIQAGIYHFRGLG